MPKYKHILALDPSGSFHEGKGTTGWCLFDSITGQIIKTGSIRALDYPEMEAYWEANLILIHEMKKQYPSLIIICEDYFLYAHKASDQINSHMETPKLIGCIQHDCWLHKIPYKMQNASQAKTRWTNEILHYKGYLIHKGRRYLPATGDISEFTRHSIDAIRHAVHYHTFEN